MIRDGAAHRDAFSSPVSYLASHERGLAGGPEPLSNYRHGTIPQFPGAQSLDAPQTKRYPEIRTVSASKPQTSSISRRTQSPQIPGLELMAAVSLNIVCYRYNPGHLADDRALNALNKELLQRLQEQGIATPSYTVLNGRYAIRVAITNHRSTRKDDCLVETSVRLGKEIQSPVDIRSNFPKFSYHVLPLDYPIPFSGQLPPHNRHGFAVDPAAISDSCPHLPAISFPPGRSSLTRSPKKSLLRQAAPIALSCDSCKICLVVSCQFSSGRDNTSNQVCWDRGIRTANYLCNNLHVPENRVAFTYAGNGPPDKLTLEWVSRSEWPDTPSPHSKLHPADTIIVHFNLNQSSLSPEADTIIDQYFSSHIKPSRPLRISRLLRSDRRQRLQ